MLGGAASAPAGGAGGFGGGSTFSFGTGAFPPVAAAPLAGAASGGAAGGEGGEEEEGGEGGGDEGVALFGNAVVQPVVSLPEQEKRTGEEQEQSVFAGERERELGSVTYGRAWPRGRWAGRAPSLGEKTRGGRAPP